MTTVYRSNEFPKEKEKWAKDQLVEHSDYVKECKSCNIIERVSGPLRHAKDCTVSKILFLPRHS